MERWTKRKRGKRRKKKEQKREDIKSNPHFKKAIPAIASASCLINLVT